jgi:S-disulfanyl-L-cysteine oxidoreductase SoxD
MIRFSNRRSMYGTARWVRTVTAMAGAGLGIVYVTGVASTVAARQGASSVKTVWDGVYSVEQTKRGESRYMDACSGCHGKDLRPTDAFATPLAGSEFMHQWEDRSLDDLFSQVSTTMPLDSPGSLSADAYVDILAFLLQFNGFPAGPDDLKAERDKLKTLTFTKAKPQ